MVHLHKIFTKLNLSERNGLFLSNTQRESLFSNRIERLLVNVIKPDAFFCVDNKPFILFFENLTNKKEKLKQVWNFNESPIVIISENDSVEIYNGFEFITKKESLKLFGKEEKLSDFSYYELVTGMTWKKYQKNFDASNRIDYHLLNNIKAARAVLISKSLSPELANSILGKIIFVRYLIDRKVKLDFEQQGESHIWTNREFCELLSDKNRVISFFKYLKVKFNGDLFPLNDFEINSIPSSCLQTLIQLLSGDEVQSGQKSLFDLYDFSIIPVEFISNVYELFIGQNQQEEQGAYYTPLFLVDYILAETVEQKLKSQEEHNCRVLDPSCGSGIFLVETLRKIIEKYQEINPNYIENPTKYKQILKEIAVDNIFGIDKDKSAINVAIFSIYLTLLDYQEPSDIESFKFPVLLQSNFFINDFFDVNALFNNVLKGISFDFILGNPPWKRGQGKGELPLYLKYILKRKEKEKDLNKVSIKISNKEIAQAFILRTSDFCSEQTNNCLIITSKALYNINAKEFRQYFLHNFFLNRVFELAPVRKEVFNKSNDKAVGPATVLFYRYAKNKITDDNIVEHITLKPSYFFSLFKVFTIQRHDYKKVIQKKLMTFDYLWKILVYGNYLDFNLIQRLKDSKNYLSLDDVISDKSKFLVGQGAMIGGGDKNNASHLIGCPLIDTRKDIESFWVNSKTQNIWNYTTVHRPRNPALYQAPMVLITEGINNHFRAVSAVCEDDVVFKSSLTAINSLDKNMDTLYSITGILNSSLFSYLCLQTFSSSGIEREQSHDKEKWGIPFIESPQIASIASSLSKLKIKEKDPDNMFDISISKEIKMLLKTLDNTVVSSFSFSKMEKDLIAYSNEITIPLIMKHKGFEKVLSPLLVGSQVITDYINLFIDSFNEIYSEIDLKLIVNIKHTKHIIGLFFKIVPQKKEINSILIKKEESNSILQFLFSLGIQKITDKLFIQKDIRGFEDDGFYIIKPNEYKLWHKAIAHLDLNEFRNSILMAGKNSNSNV